MADNAGLSAALDGIPMVADAAARDARFPLATRKQNQRVFRLDTLTGERWSGSSWLTDHAGKGPALFDVTSPLFGAAGDGTTDDAAAINACNTAATAAGGLIYFPPGKTFKILSGVTFTTHVDARGASLTTPSNITAVTVGAVPAQSQLVCWLPKVFRTSGSKSGDVGVRLLNLDDCEVWVPRAESFEVGLLCDGSDVGFQYNKVHIGVLWDNKINQHLTCLAAGDCNENNFYGGRYVVSGSNVAGTRHILVDDVAASIINNNRWWGPSLEGDGPEFHVEMGGAFNAIFWARWEATTPKVKWNSSRASNNLIYFGYQAEDIVETTVGSPVRNEIHTTDGIRGTQIFLTGARTAESEVALPTATATTLFDLASYGQGVFEIAVWQNGGTGTYSKLAMVVHDGTPVIASQSGAAAITFSVSGTTIKAAQSSGGTVTVRTTLRWTPYN